MHANCSSSHNQAKEKRTSVLSMQVDVRFLVMSHSKDNEGIRSDVVLCIQDMC